MPHGRTQIRTAALAAIEPAVAPVPAVPEQAHRIDPATAPYITISLTDDEIDDEQAIMGSPVGIERQQTILVQILSVQATGELACEEIDDLEVLVEQALGADPTLGGVAEQLWFDRSSIEMETSQDRVSAVRSVEYTVMWRHAFGAPDSPEG